MAVSCCTAVHLIREVMAGFLSANFANLATDAVHCTVLQQHSYKAKQQDVSMAHQFAEWVASGWAIAHVGRAICQAG